MIEYIDAVCKCGHPMIAHAALATMNANGTMTAYGGMGMCIACDIDPDPAKRCDHFEKDHDLMTGTEEYQRFRELYEGEENH